MRKLLVIARCGDCNKAIAGGWYDDSEKELVLEQTQNWIKRGFLITMSKEKVGVALEQHEESCPNNPNNM